MDDAEKFPFYKTHPGTRASSDFWGQVARTVNGESVGEEQIQLIVESILNGLQIRQSDTLLDLCCGNGALSDRIFARCREGLGVDFSELLIAVAEQHFQLPPQRMYRLEDVESFLRSSDDTIRFSKAFCYGSFQYLPEDKAKNVLILVRKRFPGVERFFVGNLPDKAKMGLFFKDRSVAPGIESDPASQIGIWRTEAEFAALARMSGWEVEFRRLPLHFYAAAYRYDAVLTWSARWRPAREEEQ